MARPRSGRQTPAEYQRRYRERKKAQQALTQTNWMLDARLTDAIREEAKTRGIRESQVAFEILERWYVDKFGVALPSHEATDVPASSELEDGINTLMEQLLTKLEGLGFVVPLQGLAFQPLYGDAENGLTAMVGLSDSQEVEFGLTEHANGESQNVLHCVVDTTARQAWINSETHPGLNGVRDIDAHRMAALDEVFEHLKEFIMSRRRPLNLDQILARLPANLADSQPRTLVASVFKREGLQLIYLPPLKTRPGGDGSQTVALHDLSELARYARKEMLRTQNDMCRFELDDGSELLAFPPEARATVCTAVGIPLNQYRA